MSWPVCCSSKKASSSDWRWRYIRLRRSYSTPSETRPAISRRRTLNASRTRAAPRIAIASGQRFVSPLRISSTVRPTRNGISTPVPIATAASTNETITPRRYGRRKVRSRQKVPKRSLLYFVKYGLSAVVEDRREVASDKCAVGERAERAEGQRVAHRVAHDR